MPSETDQNEVPQLANKNYKTYVLVGIRWHEVTKTKFLLDACAGQTLVGKSFLCPIWVLHVESLVSLKLRITNKLPISSAAVILLNLQTGGLRTRM